jgi:hypothetical protein
MLVREFGHFRTRLGITNGRGYEVAELLKARLRIGRQRCGLLRVDGQDTPRLPLHDDRGAYR